MNYDDMYYYYKPMQTMQPEECIMPSLDWQKDCYERFINDATKKANEVYLEILEDYFKVKIDTRNEIQLQEVLSKMERECMKIESSVAYTNDSHLQTTIQLVQHRPNCEKKILDKRIIRQKFEVGFK